jgi:ABC-type sugar transport system substrate-binding protein
VNKILKILALLFGLAFLFFLFLSIQLMVKTPFLSKESIEEVDIMSFHYAFFLPAADHSFFSKVRDGAIDAALSMDCAITFYSIDSNPISFEMAGLSGFDGFGVYLYEKDDLKLKYMEESINKGISIVQIENQVLQGPNSFFIGTNNFDVGKGIGQLAQKSEIESLNIILVYSEKNPGLMSDDNLIEMGIKSILGNRLTDLRTEKTSLNPLDAEMLAYDLLKNDPSINIIVLTDPNDTLVTIQAIIDMNLVGMVRIIGFGEHETIKSYIDKGVILGSIVRNPYRIGFSTVMALKEISINGYTSAYVDTGITLISGNN